MFDVPTDTAHRHSLRQFGLVSTALVNLNYINEFSSIPVSTGMSGLSRVHRLCMQPAARENSASYPPPGNEHRPGGSGRAVRPGS